REIFGQGVDKYFTPFLTASHTHHFKNREKRDVQKLTDKTIPQIMAGNAQNFIWAAKELKSLGYDEVNLNLGCPVPTVVNRHKGSGLLQDTQFLENMLSEIFTAAEDEDFPRVSLKTRLGFEDPEESKRLMEIYAGFPATELIIHARIREDLYKGSTRLDCFKEAVKTYRNSGGQADICYNGDITSIDSYKKILDEIGRDTIDAVMIGRGLLYDPGLVRTLKSVEANEAVPSGERSFTKEELKTYLEKLYSAYEEIIPEDRNVIFKMLEHWAYLQKHFPGCEKDIKTIRKSRSKGEYRAAVNALLAKGNW
nr:tRNA-dihydrouridine synthase [Butyrivibrio sp.]